MDMVELDADKATGELVPLNTTNVDFSASPYNGLWFPCSGSIFPYGDTHLGSEEFEPDCRFGLDTNFADQSRSGGVFGECLSDIQTRPLRFFFLSCCQLSSSPPRRCLRPSRPVQLVPGRVARHQQRQRVARCLPGVAALGGRG